MLIVIPSIVLIAFFALKTLQKIYFAKRLEGRVDVPNYIVVMYTTWQAFEAGLMSFAIITITLRILEAIL